MDSPSSVHKAVLSPPEAIIIEEPKPRVSLPVEPKSPRVSIKETPPQRNSLKSFTAMPVRGTSAPSETILMHSCTKPLLDIPGHTDQ